METGNEVAESVCAILLRQTELVRSTIADLSALKGTLPEARRQEVQSIISRLESALENDRAAIERLRPI